MGESLTVRVHARGRDTLRELFGSPVIATGAVAEVDGHRVELTGVAPRHGMSTEDAVLSIVINLATGVPASLAAAWIYERLARSGRQPVEVGDDPVVKVTEAEIAEALSRAGADSPGPRVGIITALAEEYDAVRVMLGSGSRFRAPGPGGGREYFIGEIQSPRGGVHRVVLAQTLDMGNTSAASRASKMLADFGELDHMVMCGIAGGVPNPAEPAEHVRLGDVVVSNRKGVIQYDFGKQKGKVFEERFAPRPPSARLLEAVQLLEQDRLAGVRPWETHLSTGLTTRSLAAPAAATDVIFDEKGESIEHPADPGPRPRVFLGSIASANVVQSDFRRRDRLRDQHKVKAVEMEGYGVADATWEYEKTGYLVVRGICDYCDVRTKHLQTDAWKRYAAMAAAAYVRALLEAIPGEQPKGPR